MIQSSYIVIVDQSGLMEILLQGYRTRMGIINDAILNTAFDEEIIRGYINANIP